MARALRLFVGALSGFVFVAVTAVVATTATAQVSFVAFESGPVRPLALSPDRSRLFALNTPDNHLEVFDVAGGSFERVASIAVGMEPVAVAARTNSEVWVVNHLSDSVSIVDLSATPPQVVRTLLVGDEPRDIVFAGTGGNRAFITTAHRGQHRTDFSITGARGGNQHSDVKGGGDPQLTTPGIGRADVWVFDASNLGASLGGTPLEILTLFGDTPRALAVSPDGNTVYAATFHSGNQTTSISDAVVCDGFDGTCGVPGPSDNADGVPAPETGLIVKFDGTNWRDVLGRDWSASVNLALPDHDVFAIDANALSEGAIVAFDHVGTILFNMAVNPVSGRLYVTNTDLRNDVRFEGPGDHGGTTVQGRLSESRITVIDPSGPSVSAKHLNQHIDYGRLHTDVPDTVDPTQIDHSLATPLQPIVSSDGSTLYVAAYGSGKIGVFDTSDIEDPLFALSFDPTVESERYITTPGGPSGLALDEIQNRLYVFTRFGNSVVVIDLATKATIAVYPFHNPEPASVVDGRRFLYDALTTSGNGEASCASCHIFGDFDSLAWNLGNPDASTSINSQPSVTLQVETTFHPMKGPMTTQTLRGLATHGGMHWRGDRVDGFFGSDPCSEPAGAPCSEDLSFRNFIVAFEGLVGRKGTISPANMQKFSDFMLQVVLPPNPVRALDNSLTSRQEDAEILFGTCETCHRLSPAEGLFGSGGEQASDSLPQHFKVPHLRNLYTKVGMFGDSQATSDFGDQVRGFGFLNDGSVDTVGTFLAGPIFTLSSKQEKKLEEFVLAFSSDLAPIVGQQVTLDASNGDGVNPRIDLMIERASTSFTSLMLGGVVTECDVVAKGSVGGSVRGWVRESNGVFRDDLGSTSSDADVRALAATEGPITYTCAPPGSGVRMGINRDEDLFLDGLDNCPDVPNDDQLDSNSDGQGDACEAAAADTDSDGVPDGSDNCPATRNAHQGNYDGDAQGDACDEDDDDDGLADVVETGTGFFVSALDTGSDAMDPDSDGDGFEDGFEVSNKSDPNDPESLPIVQLPALPGAGRLLLIVVLLAAGALTQHRLRGISSAV